MVCLEQGFDQIVQVAGQNSLEFVQGEINAVIRDAVLWEIVRPYPLTPVTRADLEFPLLSNCRKLLVLEAVLQTGPQYADRLGPVFVLALFVLTRSDKPRGEVGDADR